ncbi:MAG: hypothetical protein Q8P82_03435, partial [bacterium]|nr:hypothetical protein [bacterium]
MWQVVVTVGNEQADAFTSPYVGLVGGGLILLCLGLIALFVIRKMLWSRAHTRKGTFERVVLLVQLPKEAAEMEKAGEERLDRIQEGIGVAETFLAAIGGLRAERGFMSWLYGREDQLAFEMVAQGGLISFYVAIPRNLQNFIEEQLQAQYPDALISEVEDYNIFTPQGEVAGTMLTFKRIDAFPIKTYRKLGADPLNALTNAMSKIPSGDGAAIQYVVRSARSSWRSRGIKMASLMQQGKKPSEAQSLTTAWGGLIGTIMPKGAKKEPGKEKELYRLSPLEEEMVKSIEEKSSKLGVDVNIRLIASSKKPGQAHNYLRSIVGAFSQYNSPQFGNMFVSSAPSKKKLVRDFIF